MSYYANDRYAAVLTAGYSVGQTTLYVSAVPNNVPTIIVAAKGTDNETVFEVTGKTTNSLTGVSRLRGANVDLDAQTPLTCLNNEEFINQLASVSAVFNEEHDETGKHTTDQINEKTEDAGVTVDGVLLKDNSVTASQQPSSFMYLSSNMSVSSGLTNHTITFDSTAFNIGSGWNTTSNKYVAPQAGMYLVSLEVDVINGTVGYTFNLIIQKNSIPVCQKWCAVSNSGNHGDDISTIVPLAKDDEIKFVFYPPSTDSNRTLAGGDTLETVAYITKLH